MFCYVHVKPLYETQHFNQFGIFEYLNLDFLYNLRQQSKFTKVHFGIETWAVAGLT